MVEACTWYWGFCTSPSHRSSVAAQPPASVTAHTPRPQPATGQVLPAARNPWGVEQPATACRPELLPSMEERPGGAGGAGGRGGGEPWRREPQEAS